MERDNLSSDDEEDGGEAPHSDSQPRRSAFEISHLTTRIGRRLGSYTRRYLLALCLPLALILLLLLLLLLFYTPDLRRVFQGALVSLTGSPSDRTLEAELRALYLLRNQQLGLLHLWNRTLAPIPPSPSNAEPPPISSPTTIPNPNPVSLNGFQSALLEQIKLNKQIQKTLLSSHQFGNTTATSDSSDSNARMCQKAERSEVTKRIEWRPRKDRYLFAICLSGQMSNHLICLEKHMFVAALLDRVLVLPSPTFDYDYNRVLNIKHINDCFGRKVVVSFSEFAESKKNRPVIDRFICYIASPPCYLDEEHINKLKHPGVSLGKIEPAWPEDASQRCRRRGSLEISRPSLDPIMR